MLIKDNQLVTMPVSRRDIMQQRQLRGDLYIGGQHLKWQLKVKNNQLSRGITSIAILYPSRTWGCLYKSKHSRSCIGDWSPKWLPKHAKDQLSRVESYSDIQGAVCSEEIHVYAAKYSRAVSAANTQKGNARRIGWVGGRYTVTIAWPRPSKAELYRCLTLKQ
jgi:hypothetical protein